MQRRSARLKKNLPSHSNDDNITNQRGATKKTRVTPSRSKQKTIQATKDKASKHSGSTGDLSINFDPKWKHTKGRRGLLKKLASEAPRDILLEIFAYLGLPDLLSLSRSCKDLRSLLLNKNATGTQTLWAHVRETHLDIPQKPEGVSDPCYAAFLFDTFCSRCLTPNVNKYLYMKRICQKCFGQLTTDQLDEHVQKSTNGKTLKEIGITWLPIQDCLPRYRGKDAHRLVNAVSIHEAIELLDGYDATPPALLPQFLDKQRKNCNMKQQFVEDCICWESLRWLDRSIELDVLRKQRRQEILERLKKLGWGEELSKADHTVMSSFTNLAVVKKPQALTDRIWNNISTEVIDFMESVKSNRMAYATKCAIVTRAEVLERSRDVYLLTQPPDTIVPRGPELALLPVFQEVLMKDILTSDITPESFSSAWVQATPFIAKWRTAAIKRILEESNSLSKEADFYGAARRWSCSACQYRNLQYPAILLHECRFSGYKSLEATNLLELPQDQQILVALGQSLLRDKTFEYHEDERTTLLLAKCGLSPSATLNEIQNLNPVFVFTPSRNHSSDEGLMLCNFPFALYHRKYAPLEEIRIVTDEERRKWNIESQYPNTAIISSRHESLSFRCRKCVKLIGDLSHFKKKHSIVNPVYGEDYVLNSDLNLINFRAWPEWFGYN